MGLVAPPQPVELVLRSLLVLTFCYLAWRRILPGLVLTVLATLSSIAWFPAPETPSAEVQRYLDVKRRRLANAPLAVALSV